MMIKSIITGMGGITPMGDDIVTITKNLKEERSNIQAYQSDCTRIKASTLSPCDTSWKEMYDEFIPNSIYNDTLTLSYAAITKALEDAGLSLDVFKSRRVALVSATGATGLDGLRSVLSYQDKRVSPFALLKMIPTAVSGSLCSILKVKGPTRTVQHACASGVSVVTTAMDLIELGKADIVVCVCAEKISEEVISGFDAMRALYRGSDHEQASLPFDQHRAGFTISEGSGCLIVETEQHYLNRKATKVPYGVPLVYADYSDGNDLTNPNGEGATACLREVFDKLSELGLYPDLISAHATSTPNGDIAEAKAIYEVFKDSVPVVATKGLTGHSVTAAAIHEIMYCLLMMREGFIVSTPAMLDDETPKICLLDKQKKREINVFIKNAFGFGGLNSVIGIKKYGYSG